MPTTSSRQAGLMAMCSTDEGRAKAKRLGIECPPIKVAKEFHGADKSSPAGRRRLVNALRRGRKRKAA